VFGGAKYKRFFTDLHEYDASTGAWGLIKPDGGKPPTCSYHTITLYVYLFQSFSVGHM
jgi:hypothetical protein